MVVSVKLRLKSLRGAKPGAEVEVVAGVNSHYPAFLGPGNPELLLTKEVAENLGLHPPEPSWPSIERISVGGVAHGWFVEQAVEACVVEGDRNGPSITAHAYIVPGFAKVLISDAAIKPLGIWTIDEAMGLWCFEDELRDVLDGKRKPRSSAR